MKFENTFAALSGLILTSFYILAYPESPSFERVVLYMLAVIMSKVLINRK